MIEILSAKNGKSTLKKDKQFLLSRYRPEKDAERYICEISPDQFFILFSAALGHLPRRLLDLNAKKSDILIFEPHQELFKHSFHSEFSECLVQKEQDLEKFLETKLTQHRHPRLIFLPSFVQAFPKEFYEFENLIKEKIRKITENIKVDLYFSKNWFLNFHRNIRWLQTSPHIRILDPDLLPLSSRPVFVTASGSSLNTHLSFLRKIQSNFPILSVLSSVRTLTRHQIYPDAIVITDAGPANKLHASKIPPNIPILASLYAHHGTLKSLPNPILFFDADSELKKTTLALHYPTVTLEAGMLARRLSQKNPIFVGFDLSYPLSGSSHSRENALYSLRIHLCQRFFSPENLTQGFLKRKDLQIKDQLLTHPQFLGIHEQTESLFANSYFLTGGLSFKNLKSLQKSDLPSYKDPKTLQKKLLKIKRKALCIQKLPELSDPNIQKRVFAREIFGNYFDPAMVEYFSKKLKLFS